jgi:hypothetical protein
LPFEVVAVTELLSFTLYNVEERIELFYPWCCFFYQVRKFIEELPFHQTKSLSNMSKDIEWVNQRINSPGMLLRILSSGLRQVLYKYHDDRLVSLYWTLQTDISQLPPPPASHFQDAYTRILHLAHFAGNDRYLHTLSL